MSVKRALGDDVSMSLQAILAPSLRVNNAGDGTFSRMYAHKHSLIIVFICNANWNRLSSVSYWNIDCKLENIPGVAVKQVGYP